jgi:hypothetical protein
MRRHSYSFCWRSSIHLQVPRPDSA